MILPCLLLISIFGCSTGERTSSPSKRIVRTRRLKPNNAEFVPDQFNPWSETEPSCDQLRELWILSKRQARASEITNEIPVMHDPFLVGKQLYFSSTEPTPVTITESKVYGKVVYTPRDEPVRSRPMDKLRSLTSGSRSQRRLAYVDSNRLSRGAQRGLPKMEDSMRLFEDRPISVQTVESNPRGGFDRLRDSLRTPMNSFPIRRPDASSRPLASYGTVRHSPTSRNPYPELTDEFSEEDNDILINMIKRYETNKKHAAAVKRLIEKIQELSAREKQNLKRILEERSENRKQMRKQRDKEEVEAEREELFEELRSSTRGAEDKGPQSPSPRGRRRALASGNLRRPLPPPGATRTFQ